jgi:flavin-dependent dehydrogenase
LAPLRAECLVVGAGPAGLTVSRLLSLKGRQVVIVDPGSSQRNRLELLSPIALGTIAALGLSSLLSNHQIARSCLGVRSRWISREATYNDFFRYPNRTGYVVDRARFDDALRKAAVAAGVEFVKGRVAAVESHGSEVGLKITEDRAETVAFADIIIDATGRAAAVARRMGAKIAFLDRRIGELIEETVSNPEKDAAWLDVWKGDEASWSYQIRGGEGKTQIWRIRPTGTELTPGTTQRSDASARILSTMAGKGWMAVGDAASAFDPIASQGLFNALSSALVATGVLQSCYRLGPATARAYSDAFRSAFYWSEAVRSDVYLRWTGHGAF